MVIEDQKDEHGNGPLAAAAKAGDAELCRGLLEAGADLEASNRFHTTAIHWGCASDSLETVRLLVEWGANVSAADRRQQTPLMWAAVNGRADIGRWLLSRPGVSTSMTSTQGWTAAHYAALRGHGAFLEVLLGQVNDDDASVGTGASVDAGDVDVVDIDARDEEQATPLHLAAGKGALGAAQVLVRLGAGVNLTDKDGWTPLHRAARYGHREVAHLLVSRGAKVGMQSKHGKTAAALAKDQGHDDVADFLLSRLSVQLLREL